MIADRAADASSPWLKARASTTGTTRVELRRRGAVVEVRDSKNPRGPVPAFTPDQFTAWPRGASGGEFTHLKV